MNKIKTTSHRVYHLVSAFIIFVPILISFGCSNAMVGFGPGVDVENPLGIVEDLENGDYVNGQIILSGTAEDDVKIKSVTAQISGETLTASLEQGTITDWEIPVDTTLWPDGEYTIVFTITDDSGRTGETRLLLYFDNTPPTVLVTSGEGITDDGASTKTPTISGEAYDYPFSRLESVTATVVSGSAEAGTVEGKNGWQFPLSTWGTGTYRVRITARDMAGNENEYLYHIYGLPGGTQIEDLAEADAGLTEISFSEYRQDDQEVVVDLSQDEPNVVVSNPSSGIVVGGSAAAVGYIEDDDEVDTDSVEISMDDGTTWESIASSQIEGSTTFVRWSYDLSSLANGNYVLKVRAADANKPIGDMVLTGYSESIPFTMDKDAPTVGIDTPLQGAYLNTTAFTVEGTASDPGGQITDVTLTLNGGEAQSVTFSAGEYVNWSHSVSSAPEGTLVLRIVAKDDSNKSSTFSQQINVDIQDPEIEILSPSEGLFVNGTVTVRGVNSDNWNLSEVKIQIGGSEYNDSVAESLAPDEFYSWTRSVVTGNYETTSLAREVDGEGNPSVGTGIWKLKMWVKAVDMAGNESLTEHYFFIDNSLDRPGVSIASPSDGSTLAGAVNFAGNAWDDRNETGEDLDHIEIRIWKGQDGSFNETFDLGNLGEPWDPANNLGDGWYEIEGTSSWSQELNTNGEFYPDESNDHDGTCKIEVRAVDQKDGIPDVAGNPESMIVSFDDTVPFFEGLNYSSGDFVKENFTLTGTVKDDEWVERLRISYNGGVDWETIGSDLGDEASFSHSIDTTDTAVFSDTSGILYLRLEALDSANYKTIQTINLNVDNVDPEGSYTAALTDMSGTARVQGTAGDDGVVSGIEKIVVSFEQDGVQINPEDSTGSSHPIEINARNESGNDTGTGGDEDGFDESLTLSGSTYEWWADFNSLSFEDGDIDIIYTVYDNAGNTYTEAVSGNIKNHAPEISSVDLAWDLDHDNTIETVEESSYTTDSTEPNPVFGDLDYTFTTDYDEENGDLTYTAEYSSDDGSSWDSFAEVAESGTIDTTDLDDGDYDLRFTVTDEKNYSTGITVSVEVANTDEVAPTMNFFDLDSDDAENVKDNGIGHIELTDIFGTGHKVISGTALFSGEVSDEQKIAQISYSINSGSETVIAQWDEGTRTLQGQNGGSLISVGFIEENGTIIHHVEWVYEWDSSLASEIDGADLDVEVTFTVTDGGGNSSSHSRTFDVAPYISSIETGLSGSYSDSLARSALGRYPVYQEPVTSTAEGITLHGYNLNTTHLDGIRLSSDPDALDSGSPVGTALTNFSDTDGSGSHGTIELDVDADGSGYLTIIVNGVPSLNNINPDISLNREESDVHRELSDDRYISIWQVERLWEDFTLADHALYPSMAMYGDTPSFVFVNNSEGYGQGLFYDGSTDEVKQIIDNWDLFTHTCLGFTSDGEHAALVDVNVVNGNFGNYNAGNYGGILSSFFFDVHAHNWGNYDYVDNHLWLENLVDTSSSTTAVLGRYQFPDIEVRGASDNADVFYSVYDTLEDRLIFRHFLVGTDATVADDTTIDPAGGGRINNEGTALYTNLPQYDRDGDFPNYNGDDRFAYAGSEQPGKTPPGAQEIAGGTAAFSAVAATGDAGTALLAYYDKAGSGSLLFKYNETPDSGAGWSSGITIDTFVDAQYIDMAVDGDDHIHLAYFDSYNGDVKYAYIPDYDSSASEITLVTVDSYLIVGSKLTVTVDSEGTPYLSYKGIGNSARTAWPASTGIPGDGAENDEFTGNWEIQTLPEGINDSDSNRFCVGTDTEDLPVVGYTDDGLEYLRMLAELSD